MEVETAIVGGVGLQTKKGDDAEGGNRWNG